LTTNQGELTMATTHTRIENVEDSQFFASVLTFAAYLLAGRAVFTMLNENTQVRHTYSVEVRSFRTSRGGWKRAYDKGPWKIFVRAANGHGGHYMPYIGELRQEEGRLVFERRHNVPQEANDKRLSGFEWLIARINAERELPACIKVWRPHNCGRCGAELTSEYRLLSYGPICCDHLGIDSKRVFKTLADLGGGETRKALETARALVYNGILNKSDSLILRLMPGMAGEYARSFNH